ncbi:protein hook [Uranotaenia lowii]|uniref:protein hook n=1 Tax=Uranotaenia lowii TaxID=190385 RepID=UPI002479E3BA|nr:protein hook [Uranotaenia lowii]
MENSDKMEIYESLIRWLSELHLPADHKNALQLSDGVALAQALNQIAPETFSDSWLTKIKVDVGNNWRLKVSNLKKIIEGVYIYYQDVLSLYLSEELRPDAMKIAEKCDEFELGRLLQLILGCAVNCLEKQKYITQIMELEESLQRNIMAALQDIEYVWQGASPSRNSINASSLDVKTLQEDRDSLAQKCHEMNKKMLILIEEKTTLQQELNKLQSVIDRYEHPNLIGDDGTSLGPIQLGSSRYNDLRKLVDSLKDDLMQAETARDDLKMKSTMQEKEITDLQVKVDELHAATAEIAQLKDEIDILKEANDKLKIAETQLNTYKKKLEDYNDLKKQIKMLEERSADYLKQNLEYEEEAKKFSGLKGQVELYKKEIQDLHLKLDTEMSKTMKTEFEYNQLQTKLSAVQREKENLLGERDALREICDELKCGQVADDSEGGNTMSKELHSSDIRDRIERLEKENKALREGQGGQTALSQLLDDANQRNEKLRDQLKTANQRILLLSQSHPEEHHSSKSDIDIQLKQALELNEQRSSQIDDLQSQNAQLRQELQAADTRFKKCVEKAKEVIKTLDPRVVNEALILDKSSQDSEGSSSSTTTVASTMAATAVNVAGIVGSALSDAAEQSDSKRAPMGLQEEQLITTAFYRMANTCQREAVDSRLALLSGPGQSFLSRQRQPAPRKPMNMTYVKK